MWNWPLRAGLFVGVAFLLGSAPVFGGTVVFFDREFPSVENGAITRPALERAFSALNVRFIGLADLQKENALAEGDLLVIPYGSAFPAEAWETVRRHLDRGNLLILGGRPFFVPVYRDGDAWRIDPPTNAYAKAVGIEHSYEAPQKGPWSLRWDDDLLSFSTGALNPRRVFVNAGQGGRYRGIGFLVDDAGNRLAAPVVAEDRVGRGLPPRRRVYLSFDAEPAFWESSDGIALIRQSAIYAARGGVRLWIDLQHLTLTAGEPVTGAVDLLKGGGHASLTVELLSRSNVLATRGMACDSSLHEEFEFTLPPGTRGLVTVRATLSSGDTVIERYTSGVSVRDSALLRTGSRLEAGRDYFRLDGKPYLMVGANYFSTDPYTRGFFVGGSIGGNAYVWDRDFAEMERRGFTAVRTGLWLNRERYLDVVSGGADERLLRAIEAYLSAAARHHMQVMFTFFAFHPKVELSEGGDQEGERTGPGPNPYLDPASLDAEKAYVRSIASRFRDVPFLSYDLINEPSVTNPGRLWKGNSPNGDPKEQDAWQRWLEKRYGTVERLAHAWHTTPAALGPFSGVPLPAFADLEPARSGNARIVRAVDYNLFAQDLFGGWVDVMIGAIRSAGARQAVTVGQDEGGVTDRVLNQFWAGTGVSFTVNHTWWRDDALLWNSVVARTPDKPNLIGETGPQPVWGTDGSWRWDEVQGMGLEERKLVLGFANANTGVLHWDWSRDELFSLLRRDGSEKQWMNALGGIAAFARTAGAYATEAARPEIALVLPQSLQLSVFGSWALGAQQNAVRALYSYARGTAIAVGEYQLSRLPDARLIIVPAPWVLRQEAWDQLMERVKAGATLLVSGRIDADEHWLSVPGRGSGWNAGYRSGAMTTREVEVRWPGGTARLTFGGEKTTYAERGFLGGEKTFLDLPIGKGRILYFALPLELSDRTDDIGRIYRYAMKRAGVRPVYETDCDDPGITICPTVLPDATLYVLTSESSGNASVSFRDIRSGAALTVRILPGRGALLLIRRDGTTVASYNAR